MSTLNKTYAIAYFEKFGFNVLPLVGKKPIINWEEWQSKKQSIEDIEKMDWEGTTGIGTPAGLNDVRVIDIDKIKDWGVLDLILEKLNLDAKYPWIVRTGSGLGAHIYIKVKVTSKMIKLLGGDKAVYKLYLKQEGLCDHVEIRWVNCQNVLPPSKHPSGGIYNFYDINPTSEPIEIEEDIFINLIENLFILKEREERREMKIGGRNRNILIQELILRDWNPQQGILGSIYLRTAMKTGIGLVLDWLLSGSKAENILLK